MRRMVGVDELDRASKHPNYGYLKKSGRSGAAFAHIVFTAGKLGFY